MWVVVLALSGLCSAARSEAIIQSTRSYDNLLAPNFSTVEPPQNQPQFTTPEIIKSPILPLIPQDGKKELLVTSASSEAPEEPEPTPQDIITTILPSLLSNSSLEGNETELYNSTEGSGLEDLRMLEEEGLGLWPIVGISLAVILIALLIGAVTFVLYRHSLWNRPQTLSDKCSNDESTGYIDDSAFRENSEELYSLDNDSFLNSLEAMTIQNYWTDHVKHTKL